MPLEVLAQATAAGGAFSPLKLFMDADIVVKAVIIGLLLASVWAWAIIIGFTLKMGSIRRRTEKFESAFRQTQDIDAFHDSNGKADLPIARVFAAALNEWRRSTALRSADLAGTRDRLALAMNSTIAHEADRLSERLNFLATVGAVGPFIGLFGTVWGIMRSFTAIAASQNTSLAVVAPGIAEALFATAIGLFAAIPAVIGYNRLTHRVDGHEARLGRFADSFHAMLSRELEKG